MAQTIETKEIAIIRHEARGLVDNARDLVIVDEDSALVATRMLVSATGAKRKLEEQRIFLVKPLNDHVKDINTLFKEWIKPLDNADSILRRKLLEFSQEQRRVYEKAEAERLEQERLAAEALAAESDNILLDENDNAILEGDDFPDAEYVPPPPAPKTVQYTAGGSTGVRKTWVFEVVDETLVPSNYLMVDEGAISLAVREGVREIPGVRIYQQESLSVRAQ